MNRRPLSVLAVLMTVLAVSAGPVAARDEQAMWPLQDALNVPEAKEKLNPDIKLYFGNQKHSAVVKDFGEWKTNKKTNAFGKSDKEACEWVFLSAVLELQERAAKEGANAVIDIKSNYKNNERSSEIEYMCGSGAVVSGVALKGRVVTLGK